MVGEQDKTLEALRTAIQMEIDGKEYYLRASEGCGNELGRKLLRSLAMEESIHQKKFEEIYAAIRNRKEWPETDFRPDGGKTLRTIFARASEELAARATACATEFEAVRIAIDKENKSYDFYRTQGRAAAYDAERSFYGMLAAEEQEHHLILLDYFEYLKDPAAWFVKKEHPSLDGG